MGFGFALIYCAVTSDHAHAFRVIYLRNNPSAGKSALCLRALAAIAEDLGKIPSTHGNSQPSVSGDSTLSVTLPGTRHTWGTHTHMETKHLNVLIK